MSDTPALPHPTDAPAPAPVPAAYTPRRLFVTSHRPVRGLRYQVHQWGDAAQVSPARPLLVMMHGWMDVAASFQFVVDALDAREGPSRCIVAADWRGFGGTSSGGADAFHFADYLADLDALIDRLSPDAPVDLLGHSMGGNIVMSYAAVRPARVRRLINLEGFGLPAARPDQAPRRLAQWLDELKTPQRLRDYASPDEVAERLRQNNPRMGAAEAGWLARHWAAPDAQGRWQVLGEPAHKRTNPVLYRRDEVLAGWRLIEAPVLWVEGAQTDVAKWWGKAYPREDFEERLAVVPRVERLMLQDCGHMVHHDQPARVAERLQAFLDAAQPSRPLLGPEG